MLWADRSIKTVRALAWNVAEKEVAKCANEEHLQTLDPLGREIAHDWFRPMGEEYPQVEKRSSESDL